MTFRSDDAVCQRTSKSFLENKDALREQLSLSNGPHDVSLFLKVCAYIHFIRGCVCVYTESVF